MQKKWPCNTTRIAKIILKIRQSLAGTFGGLFFHPIISQLVYKRWPQYDQRKRENFSLRKDKQNGLICSKFIRRILRKATKKFLTSDSPHFERTKFFHFEDRKE
jgi:hypothetical protein